MKKFLLITFIILVLVTAALLTGVHSQPRATSGGIGVTLTFLGISNLPPLGCYAVFIVTNAGPERVAFDADAFEYRTSQGWLTNSLRNTTRRKWLCWVQPSVGASRLGKWDDFGSDLQSGMSVKFGAPVLVTNSVWRFDFYCVEQATGVKGLHDRAGDLAQRTLSFATNGVARDQTTFTGRHYHLISPQISD